MEGAVGAEFQDWEVLHHSNNKGFVTSLELSGEKSSGFDGIEGDSDAEGIIKADYFSLGNQGRHVKAIAERDPSDEGSVDSDNPSWIDPSSENRYARTYSGEFWSDSGSDRSDERKLNGIDSKTDTGYAEIEQSEIGHEELRVGSGKLEDLELYESEIIGFDPKMELGLTESAKNCLDFEEMEETQSKNKDCNSFWSDSGGGELVSANLGCDGQESEMVLKSSLDQSGSNVKLEDIDGHSDENREEAGLNVEPVNGGKVKKNVVWWKVPLEVLKYCVFRASPVWSFSVAAAVMGFIILGRKLYKMKKKTKSLQLKVTVDDKKVSQFMSRAARLNEAFSVVRRVPIVRPALPAAGINPWPAMSMR